MVERFSDDETACSEWLAEHPDGFVFNHFGGPPAFNVIHRARRGRLHRTDSEGRRTAIGKPAAAGPREMVSRVKQIRGSGRWKFHPDRAPAAPERAGAGRPRRTPVGRAAAILTGAAPILWVAG